MLDSECFIRLEFRVDIDTQYLFDSLSLSLEQVVHARENLWKRSEMS